MVKSEEGDIFMAGQTIENEEGEFTFTPGFTVFMDNEPTLLPGLVMGDDPEKPMFLPGESTITESGELQFTETEDDRPPVFEPEIEPEPIPEPVQEEEEEELEEEEEEEEAPKPVPKKKQEFKYERPKRRFDEPKEKKEPRRKERGPRKV